MKKTILTYPKIIKILGDKGYSVKIRKDDKTTVIVTVIIKDISTGGSYFFSGERLEELIKLINV